MKIISLSLLAVIFFNGCTSNKENVVQTSGFSPDEMDTTVNPGDDFYRFVNGRWIDNTRLPIGYSYLGSNEEIEEKTNQQVIQLIKEGPLKHQVDEPSDRQKVYNFFKVAMDSVQAEKIGLKPLLPYLELIEKIKNNDDVTKYLIEAHKISRNHDWYAPFFSWRVVSDLRNTKQLGLYLDAWGVGLYESSYYLLQDDQSKGTRRKYIEHIENILTLSGIYRIQASDRAEKVLEIETELAEAMLNAVQRRDPDLWAKIPISDLVSYTPSIKWTDYFSQLGLVQDSIYSRDVGFLKAIEKVLTQSKPDDIKAYLRWRLLDGFAPYLNHKFVKADFDFFGKHLRGEQELSSREARVLNVMRHEALGDIIGKIYVEKHFASQTKKEVADMANNIKEAFANRINNLSWMSNSTKQNALSKLRLLRIKIGHPEAWPDFTKLHINGDSVHSSYVQNVMNCFRFQFDKKVKALNQPINTEEWRMSPVTINAFYNALFNEIGIPAAILQPPFYIAGANVAINYGGIGSIIAHEISHGFDSQGKKFDADGNLNNWWTPTDLASFDEKAEKFARQIDTYEPMDNVFLNGQLVLHESIADLAGVAIAFDGLQRHIKKSTKRELVNGYSAEQLFFISYAASKRAIYTDEVLLGRIQIDAHMPDKYRINGILSNLVPFYDAFKVNERNALYRSETERIEIW